MSLPGQILKKFTDAVAADPSVSESDRNRLIDAVQTAHRDEPLPTIVIFGEAGVGKSTTINALFGAGQEVGHTKATTTQAEGYEVGGGVIEGKQGLLRVYDMPGVGDTIETYDEYRSLYLKMIAIADVVLWIHPAADRSVEYLQRVTLDLFSEIDPRSAPGFVFALNKADEIHPGDWNPVANVPSDEQSEYLAAREQDFAKLVCDRIPGGAAAPVAYSALKRYRLATVFRTMLETVREDRQWVIESRMALADLTELVDSGTLDIARRIIGEDEDEQSPAGRQPDQGTSDDGTDHPVDQGPAEQASRSVSEAVALLEAMPSREYRKLTSDKRAFAAWLREHSDPR